MKPVILITGCDAAFYPFMEEALTSLARFNLGHRADVGILDLGLSEDQVAKLKSWGCIIRQPVWTMDVPEDIREDKQLGLIARTALRDYFPGFHIYIWFDADAWAQTPDFLDLLVSGAETYGAAVIREDGYGYRRDFPYNRWWFGHMIMTYGPVIGVQQAIKPAINIGILALSDTAPHWQSWIDHYQRFIQRRRKVNLDQHAFNGALEFENLPHALVPAHCNWICTLSPPMWDEERKLLCEPQTGAPLSILHLAGPNKRRAYTLQTKSGTTLSTPLDYSSIKKINDNQLPPDVASQAVLYG